MEIRTYLQENGWPDGWEDTFESCKKDIQLSTRYLRKQKIKYQPSSDKVFRIYYELSPSKIKVIIFGQDPYTSDKADGYAFSTEGYKPMHSLSNLLKELKRTHRFEIPEDGSLQKWVKQGVFLINMSLTSKEDEAGHHLENWMGLMEATIETINSRKQKPIYVFLGKEVLILKNIVKEKGISIIKPHPSPLNTRNPFYGCGMFVEIDKALEKFGIEPIDWNLY